jgi:hypothetical protein
MNFYMSLKLLWKVNRCNITAEYLFRAFIWTNRLQLFQQIYKLFLSYNSKLLQGWGELDC